MSWILLIIFSGLISVDSRAAFHLMVSRPLFISLVIGILTSNVYLCLLAGIMIEIYGSIDVPVGTKVPKDDTFFAYVLSLLIGFGILNSPTDFITGVLLCIIFIYPVTFLEQVVRKINLTMYESFMKKNLLNPGGLLFRSFMLSFLKGAVAYNIAFFVISFILTQLELDFEIFGETYQYVTIVIMFLVGYIIRFLSFKSLYKYIVLLVGLTVGWFIV